MPANPWYIVVRELTAFGEYQLVPMTTTGERGIACRMMIESNSQDHLKPIPSLRAEAIKTALEPLLEEPPKPAFSLRWDDEQRLWQSQIEYPNALPKEIREVFEKFGYGCLALEADIGIVHVCHASDNDINGFANKPVLSCWELIKMPTAPLIRLELTILDRPENPYQFESFLNIAEENQANVLAELANQDRLHLAFYGDDLYYRYMKVIPHSTQQWQQIDEISMEAMEFMTKLPEEVKDFDRAKAEFMRDYP